MPILLRITREVVVVLCLHNAERRAIVTKNFLAVTSMWALETGGRG
jgi:hypothetical protein